jgi:hypothetical protein
MKQYSILSVCLHSCLSWPARTSYLFCAVYYHLWTVYSTIFFSHLLINGRSDYGRLQAGIARSNPAGGMDVSLFWVLSVSAPGWSRVQRSPTECGVFECNREAWTMRPWRISGCCAMKEGVKFHKVHDFREKNYWTWHACFSLKNCPKQFSFYKRRRYYHTRT